jgi:hypothetical protein
MRTAVLMLAAPLLLPCAGLRFRVQETAGLRRFSYPVRARFKTELPANSLRLAADGRSVPAQFTKLASGEVEVDFEASVGPHESREYSVQTGEGSAPGPGVRIEETASSYVVRYPGETLFEVRKDLRGLLVRAQYEGIAFLGAGSPGFVTARESTIIKSGPVACRLRFEGEEGTVDMEFPRAKSWVEVTWMGRGSERDIRAGLQLALTGNPLLADFGAGSFVYAALRGKQAATLSAGPDGWFLDLAGELFAEGRGRAEGWAHVMDRERAVAVAVDGFGSFDRDWIDISPAGALSIQREFSGAHARSLRFWLHFVPAPVHTGAVTSPQAMQYPLRVVWE